MPQLNNATYQAPNGGSLMVTAPAAPPPVTSNGGDTNNEDPRIFRTKVNKTNTSYKALIRALPRGRDLGAYPYVCVQVHRIRDIVSGKRLTVKCCKNIPGVQSCPFCDDIWARWRAAKEQPGATKEYLKQFTNQLADEEWYGNVLIRQDENHPENNGQVKVWAHSKYQHKAFQTPVDNYNKKMAEASAAPAQQGSINVDTGDAFVPYDPVNGYDYFLVGTWDAEVSYGSGRKGAPNYKASLFTKNPTPLAVTTVVDPATNQPYAQVDENSIYAILDQCHDLNFVFEDIPTPQQAITMLEDFWKEANALATQKAAAGRYSAPAGAPAVMQQAAPVAPNYASQPFPTGNFGGQQFGSQNSIPAVPANAKIATNSNAAAFMGQAPAAPAAAPAPTATPMPAPIPASAAPATPAFAQTPAAPAGNPGFPSMGMPAAAAPAAPAAPAAVQPTYTPPPAPPLQQAQPFGNTGFAQPAQQVPIAGPVPVVETDDDDSLPF